MVRNRSTHSGKQSGEKGPEKPKCSTSFAARSPLTSKERHPLRFEKFAADRSLIRSPITFVVHVIPNDLTQAVNFRVEVVQKMKSNCFQGHGQFRAAIFVFTVVADNHVLQP